jgi:hypothetical protein
MAEQRTGVERRRSLGRKVVHNQLDGPVSKRASAEADAPHLLVSKISAASPNAISRFDKLMATRDHTRLSLYRAVAAERICS